MSTKTKKVTKTQAEAVLASVAEWMGKKGYGTPSCSAGKPLDPARFERHADGTDCDECVYGPAPTGDEAARNGLGPVLKMDWDWPGKPTPTIILEGGPYDWAILYASDTHGGGSFDEEVYALAKGAGASDVQARATATGPAATLPKGVWVEPYAGYALCVYPD